MTADHTRETAKQEEQHEVSSLPELFASLRVLVLERVEGGLFRPLTPLPSWMEELAGPTERQPGTLMPGELFPFLENFLVDAEQFWKERSTAVVYSGPWVEVSSTGTEYCLEAKALRVKGKSLLLVGDLGRTYQERRDLLQKARQNSLNHQRLVKEIQFKEVLLHCIVHDLAGPLLGIKGLFSLLRHEELSPAGQRRLDIGVQAAQKMETLVKEILRVFSAEVEALETFSLDAQEAPDLLECADSVVDTLRPAAQLKDVSLIVQAEGLHGTPLKVAGESMRLERVLFNLLENALRHSPSGGNVTLEVQAQPDTVRVSVSDQGSGIEAERVPLLFRRFMRGKRRSGKAGLGLYFCRIMVEKWGGTIGYQPRETGGSEFWFQLPRVPSQVQQETPQ